MMRRVAVILVSLVSFLGAQLEVQAATPYRKLTQIWATYQFAHYLANKENLKTGLKSVKLTETESKDILQRIDSIKEWPKLEKLGDHFMVSSPEAVVTVKLTDLKTNSYEINGIAFKYDPSASYKSQLQKLEKLLSKKNAHFSFFPEAHATPLLAIAAIILTAVVIIGGITLGICALSVAGKKLNLISSKVQPKVGLDECLDAVTNWPLNKQRVTGLSCEDKGFRAEDHVCRVVKIKHASASNPDVESFFTATIQSNGEVSSLSSSDGSAIPSDLIPYLHAYAKMGQKADTRSAFNESLKEATPRVDRMPRTRGAE